MAERRMIAKSVIKTDSFIDLPANSKVLYFYLMLDADDDGFVTNPRSIMREIGATQDDMRILLAKQYVLTFETGVIVIRHWKIHNYLRKDRYKPTTCLEEKRQLKMDEKGLVYQMATNGIPSGIPSGNQVATAGIPLVDVGKDRIGKDRINIYCSSDDERPPVEADASSSQSVTTVTEQRSNGNANTVTEGRKKKNSAAVRDERFDRFWKAYPRKVGKASARKAWAKLKPSAELTGQMIKTLTWQKGTEQWTKDNGQFIPYPATWLNQGRWEDERETPQEIKPAPRHRTTLTPDMKKWLAANGKRV